MYERLPELIKVTSKLGMNSTLYTFAYRNKKNLNKYRELLHNGLNKIIYSLADTLSDEQDLSTYSHTEFFDKVSLLRFVPHGKGITEMDLTKQELLMIKELYLSLRNKGKIKK